MLFGEAVFNEPLPITCCGAVKSRPAEIRQPDGFLVCWGDNSNEQTSIPKGIANVLVDSISARLSCPRKLLHLGRHGMNQHLAWPTVEKETSEP